MNILKTGTHKRCAVAFHRTAVSEPLYKPPTPLISFPTFLWFSCLFQVSSGLSFVGGVDERADSCKNDSLWMRFCVFVCEQECNGFVTYLCVCMDVCVHVLNRNENMSGWHMPYAMMLNYSLWNRGSQEPYHQLH